jgi:hypothetical protein
VKARERDGYNKKLKIKNQKPKIEGRNALNFSAMRKRKRGR